MLGLQDVLRSRTGTEVGWKVVDSPPKKACAPLIYLPMPPCHPCLGRCHALPLCRACSAPQANIGTRHPACQQLLSKGLQCCCHPVCNLQQQVRCDFVFLQINMRGSRTSCNVKKIVCESAGLDSSRSSHVWAQMDCSAPFQHAARQSAPGAPPGSPAGPRRAGQDGAPAL